MLHTVEVHHETVQEMFHGSLTLRAPSVSASTSPRLVLFQMDASGSMRDLCKDGRSKMEHTHHTLCNILDEVSSYQNVHVMIRGFDHAIHPIVPVTRVLPHTLEEIIYEIKARLYPREMTDLELALKDSAACITAYLTEHPHHEVTHIFMTDGEATQGNKNPDVLAASVVQDVRVTNTFLAFGLDHHAETMIALGHAGPKSSNWIIDTLENAGLVYGEILHREFFAAMKDVHIHVTGGAQIYDYQLGAFVFQLTVPVLPSESQHRYHLFFGEAVTDTTITINDDQVLHIAKNDFPRVDLTPQLFRLRTQQWMAVAKGKDDPEVRANLLGHLTALQDHMTTHGLQTDPFWLNLCDDVYLTIHSLGTNRRNLCIAARETSQGRNQCYNIKDFGFCREADVPYDLSQSVLVECNETASAARMMRSCSASH